MTRPRRPLGTTTPTVHTLPIPSKDPGEYRLRCPTNLWTENVLPTWENTIIYTIPNPYYSYRGIHIMKQYETKVVHCAYPG
jgi:hypothetical protein